MKLLVNFILAFIFLNLAYSDKCKSDNFDILWRLVDIEDWKSGKIMDVHVENPRIIETNRTVNAATKRSICKNTFMGLDDLYILRLNSSGIEQIEAKSFETNKKLYHIDLSGNDLTEIPADVFEGTNLRILHLSQNKITHIASTAFDNMARLQILDLSYNMIETLNSEWFNNTNKVTYLLLNNNKIATLNAEVFKNLKHSNVDDKSLNIHLENNIIQDIDKHAFDGVERLGNLHLDYNRIGALDKNTFSSLHINSLHLESNLLTCVDGSLFEKTSIVYLDDNPFICACLAKLRTWSKENGNKVSALSRTTMCVIRELLD